ncbi:AbgT family transporter [Terrisporobacter sp.]
MSTITNNIKMKSKNKSFFQRNLDTIEKVGNKLPHPITLFGIFCVAIMVISAICSTLGVSATGELIDRANNNQITQQTINVVNLLSREGIVYMLENAVNNFVTFAPLGMVLVAMFGIGVAEGSGYISALLKRTVQVTPAKLVTPMVVFLGVMSNIASDAGYVVLVPLGALIFMSFGRHPLAGLAAGFAGVSGGFSANLIVGTIDPMLAGLSTEAAKMIDPSYTVAPTANMFFMFISTFLITILGWFVTDKIVEPRLSKSSLEKDVKEDDSLGKLSDKEKKALKYANLTFFVLVAILVALTLPQNGLLRNAETKSIIDHSPLMNGFVPILTIVFLVPSLVFGKVAGVFNSEKDVCRELENAMKSMGGYIALSFVAAQFVNYFSYTNLGTILALKGAALLETLNVNSAVLMIIFVLFTGFINLFMGSASAKWAILAPVFLPMFMKVGISPELTQVAYRIGDSTTNIISPLMSYFAMIVVFAQKYDKKAGIGTIISTMVPYSIVFLLGWIVLLAIWMITGLPLGPGAPLTI